jgi:hypothetical protein
MAKFNRMGVLAGFGDPTVSLTRRGGLNDPTPDAFDPIPFELNIKDPLYKERWSDEIELYHNPNAVAPLREEIFKGTTQFFLEDGDLVWRADLRLGCFNDGAACEDDLSRVLLALPGFHPSRSTSCAPTRGFTRTKDRIAGSPTVAFILTGEQRAKRNSQVV